MTASGGSLHSNAKRTGTDCHQKGPSQSAEVHTSSQPQSLRAFKYGTFTRLNHAKTIQNLPDWRFWKSPPVKQNQTQFKNIKNTTIPKPISV